MSDPGTRVAPEPAAEPPEGRRLALLSVTALGVVYGDIGTSPLYAMRECFHGHYAIAVTPDNVLGILSLVFWSLVVVVSIKYLGVVVRADNRGEGGMLALTSLAVPGARDARGRSAALVLLGLFGAALLYGDGMITPAISVLSAVEGLHAAAPELGPLVIPATLTILVGLFLIQPHGTGRVGVLFGPVVIAWFVALAALGVGGITHDPSVLGAIAPWHAVRFFVENGGHAFVVLAAVFLVVTGSEAMYADMGHFGARPIRLGWFALALPALLLNYFGQGALLLEDPSAVDSPFYRLAPSWALVPMIGLATAATVIASQAMISGAFSLTHQAVQLGFSPRLPVIHTSARQSGQIFVPPVNWLLMVSACALVVGFGSSSNLAAAYGIAVASQMVVTTTLLCVVARQRWGWTWQVALIALVLIPIDLAFFGSNLLKLAHGGWFPLGVGAAIFAIMSTWRRGRRVLYERMEVTALPIDVFLPDLETSKLPRVPGTAVFLTGDPQGTPLALLHNIEHNKVVHHRTVCLTLLTEDVPYVPYDARVTVKPLGEGFYRVIGHYGFMEIPDVPALLARARSADLPIDPVTTSYFLGHEKIIASGTSGMGRWREFLFAFLSQNAHSATTYFRIPPGRVVELGAQVSL